MAATALVTAILALEAKLLPSEISLVEALIKKISGKKKPVAAVKAATVTVDAIDDRDTSDPNSPFFVE